MVQRLLSLSVIALFFVSFAFAQNNVGIGTTNPSPKAVLDLRSPNKMGLLLPRISNADTSILSSGITSVEKGLLIYDTASASFFYWSGNRWLGIKGSQAKTTAWLTDASNTVTTPNNRIGHQSNQDLELVANNIRALFVKPSGRVGIGTSSPLSILGVADSITTTDGTFGALIDINNKSELNNVLSGIRFRNGSISTQARKAAIMFQDKSGFGLGNLIFAVNTASSTADVTAADSKLIIDYLGNVGIGVTTFTTGIDFEVGVPARFNSSVAVGGNATFEGTLTSQGVAQLDGGLRFSAAGHQVTGIINSSSFTGSANNLPTEKAVKEYTDGQVGSIYTGLGTNRLPRYDGTKFVNSSFFDNDFAGTGQISIGDLVTGTGVRSVGIGTGTEVAGNRAFAIGNYVAANHLGSMVLGDWNGGVTTPTPSTSNDQITMRFQNGMRFYTSHDLAEKSTVNIMPNGQFVVGTYSGSLAAKLMVVDTSTKIDGSDGAFIDIRNDENINGVSAGIRFQTGTPTNKARKAGIVFEKVSTYGRGKLHLVNNTALSYSDLTLADARLTVDTDGQIGIGITSPTSLLHVNGTSRFVGAVTTDADVNVGGEVNRTSTGAANMVPIAYGCISTTASSATVNSGSGNFTVARTGIGTYDISITGESYFWTSYTTLIQIQSSGSVFLSKIGSIGGDLRVFTYNVSGSLIDGGTFNFVVYKP